MLNRLFKVCAVVLIVVSVGYTQSNDLPKKILLSHILIEVSDQVSESDESAVEVARRKAESILAAARAGRSFSDLAARFSDDSATAGKGGLLGWVKRGQLSPEMDEAAFTLKEGEISGIVRSDFGFHILKVTSIAEDQDSPGKIPARTVPYPQVTESVKANAAARSWPHPDNPREMAVGKTTAELKEACSSASLEELHPKSRNAGSNYSTADECAILDFSPGPAYEDLVDRLVTFQREMCILNNGSPPQGASTDPELARLQQDAEPLATQWLKYLKGFEEDLGRAEAAEVKERQDADAELERDIPGWRTRQLTPEENAIRRRVLESHQLAIDERQRAGMNAHRNGLRGLLDFWRVNSNCGKGF